MKVLDMTREEYERYLVGYRMRPTMRLWLHVCRDRAMESLERLRKGEPPLIEGAAEEQWRGTSAMPMRKSDVFVQRWTSGKVLPSKVDGTYWRRARDNFQQWLKARPVTVADLRALDAEIEKRKKPPRRIWLDYSKLTPQELADLRAMMEKMQVPDEGEVDV